MDVLVGCGGGLFLTFVVLMVGSALVRAAAALANRVVGPVKPPDTFGQWDDWDDDHEPAYVKSRRRGRADRAVPEPGITKGMLVTLVAALVDAVVFGFLTVVAEVMAGRPSDKLVAVAVLFVGLPATFVVHAFLLMLLLPTTFRRAALVAFFNYLIVAAIAVAVVAAVYLVLGP